MKKHEIIEWSQLPEEMIQHIQSFLSGKEAARTTILSKTWYNAWLTRPNLDFVEKDIPEDFKTQPSESAFVKLVEETLQRYDRLNLKIRIFKLLGNYCISDEISGAISELTKKAVKLGATNLEIEFPSSKFVLPREVLQSESLVTLSMHYGSIDLHEVSCWRLKYLNLRSVRIEDNNNNNNIWDIIWTCPLIEELVLSTLVNSSYYYLVLKPGLIANVFHKLKVLSLESMVIGEWLFRDFSSKFPCLKELTLNYCAGFKEVQICSDSLERVVLFESCNCRKSRVEFDVPRIRRFEFNSTFVPSLSFKTTSTEWESHITFNCLNNSSRLVEFRKYLMELSSSKIYFHLWIYINFRTSHVIGLPKPPIVEELWLHFDARSPVESALLEVLFWSCRPNFIRLAFSNEIKNYAIERICNTLIKEEHGIYDLEEVNVVISGDIAWTWSRNLPTNTPCASAFAYSGSVGPYTHTDNVHLQLKWG